MRSTLRARVARVLGGGAPHRGAPAARRRAPAAAADPVVLRVGTTQDLDALNPYSTAARRRLRGLPLNYNLLVGFGPDLEPVAGFAETGSAPPTATPGRSRSATA